MRYSISTCSFYKFKIRQLLKIEKPFGVEIFYEFGSEDQWNCLLTELSVRDPGPFSIHAPFAFVDIAADCSESKLFETLKKPFDLYHRFNGEFYVVHTYGEVERPDDSVYRSDCRQRALERLARFHEICKAEEVVLGAENLCSGRVPLFNQEQFLRLFKTIPELRCVIDVGHAAVAGMDIAQLQKTLNHRVCAYHLHNNNGRQDSHERLRDGIIDWSAFAEGCAKYTPDAVGVFEYMNYTDMAVYQDDMRYLESLFCKS
ncbi:sugar phosphate isomerase/epimerase [uncultured Dysosmobacter sp.]|uniref:sugar phosphate isomerase/epimerase family protein n=1 Tax=uncultured Dysosmobacter sp. TaxID=2591384 RepID=UPI0026060A2B|nr:sugar phosphate isomerase/epimerase [uncultured Dysosmobacter sp.]